MTLAIYEAKEFLRERYNFFASNINVGNIEEAITSHYARSAYVTGHETDFINGHVQLIELFRGIHEAYKDMRIRIVEIRVAGENCIYNLVTATSRLVETGEEVAIKSLHI